MDQRLRLERDEYQIATVTLNRPDKRNALDLPMFQAIDRCQRELKKDRQLRAVIVTGSGEDFCSGLDLKSAMASPGNGLRLLRKWLPGNANLAQRVSVGWRRLPVPVIFALHGRCWGGGLQIALGGDFRLASPDCSVAVMESRWGLVPDMAGNLVLRELLGKDHALELAMSARVVDSAEALELGLLTRVVDRPVDHARELALSFCNRSPDAVAAIKRLYHRHWHNADRRMLAAETWAQIRMLLKPNRAIAVRRETSDSEAGKPDWKPRG